MKNKIKTFPCKFGMYFDNKGLKSHIWGLDLKNAIKNRNQYAILLEVSDEDGTVYRVKEHKNDDGDCYWQSDDGKIIFDELEIDKQKEKQDLMDSIVPVDISSKENFDGYINPEGKFYHCGPQGHTWLSEKIIEKKGINNKKEPELILDELGWIKLSDGKIKSYSRKGFSQSQINFIFDFMKMNERKTILINDDLYQISDILKNWLK